MGFLKLYEKCMLAVAEAHDLEDSLSNVEASISDLMSPKTATPMSEVT